MHLWRVKRAFAWAGLAAIAFCACGVLQAQNTGSADGSKLPMMAKDADPDWEVVTVKQTSSMEPGDQVDIHGKHVTLDRDTVEVLLLIGYAAQKDQIVGLPDWAKTVRWDIDGVASGEGEPNLTQFQAMVRKILVERFGLAVHHEQRKMGVLALRVAKSGIKLAPNTGDPNGLPSHDYRHNAGQVTGTFQNTSMADLALMLLGQVDRPVVDQTGLAGRYDFKLLWTRDEAATAGGTDAPPGLFTAIQEQLGLKLEPVKAMADVLVIDKVERPSAN
jgi:uncharacterized protein (TIGR03435 family)